MATADLQSYIETRLTALDPTIDLSPGSPAQVQFIAPLLAKLGTDPIETNIDAFLTDRFRQEFPDIYSGDPSAIRDTFVNPLILFLEPFKREIQTIKTNQSLKDPSLLSDDDADALVANVFDERDAGGFSVGVGRIFFSQPTNQQVDITSRFFTSSNLNFFPTNPVGITAEQMVFQRSGNLFYMDVPLRAEAEGAQYNIGPDTLVGVEGIFGALSVTNIREFSDGAVKLDTPSFVAQAQESLTERSLVTRRGANARLRDEFQTQVRAIQVIGANDPEMQRDILVAASPGHAWITGRVNLYDKIAYVQVRTMEGDIDDAPVAGDTLYIYLDKYSYGNTWNALPDSSRFVRFTIEEVLTSRMEESNPFRSSYLVRWSGDVPAGITLPNPAVLEGGMSKKGTVRISSLPDTGATSLVVPNAEVHVFGHTDVYVRPILQTVSKAVLSSLSDQSPLVERVSLQTTSGSNEVTDTDIDFTAAGVLPGDILSIETGSDAGTYFVRRTSTTSIWLNESLSTSATSIRYRISRSININPFEPKVLKFPFGAISANDLTTTIGSTLFTLSNDVINFGAVVGDTFRVLTGPDAGDFTITGFDPTLGGQGVIVDRAAGATGTGFQYQIFTAQNPIALPLVRIRQLLLLDSAQQSTGTIIPPAEPVAVVPTSNFTSARVRAGSQRFSGYVLPDITGYVTGGNVAAVSGDRRYSLGFDPASGTYKAFEFPDANIAEFDFRSDSSDGCSYFLAISESSDDTTNYPPIDPRPGECLTLKNGPNQGSYLIKDVVKFKHTLSTPARTVWTYFIKIYGTFPVDVFRQLIQFLDDAEADGATGAGVTKITNSTPGSTIAYPDFFVNTFDSFGTKLDLALTHYGATSPGASALQLIVEQLSQISYEWGDPARGVLRTFFAAPTLFEQNTAESENPTKFLFKTDSGETLHFRAEPRRYENNAIVPPRLDSDTSLVELPRDSSFTSPGAAAFDDSTKPSMFNMGVQIGDTLEVHEEVFFHGATKNRQTALRTLAGSSQVTAPNISGDIFTEEMQGNIIFLEEGDDLGGYRVVQVLDGKNLILDRSLTSTTPNTLAEGVIDSWGYDGSDNIITRSGFAFDTHIGEFITIYGMNYQYQGSYEIKNTSVTGTAVIDRGGTTGNFPPIDLTGGFFVITAAPSTLPSVNDDTTGTELVGLRPVRMYDDVATIVELTGVDPDVSSPSTVHFDIGITIEDGFMQPYRIYRSDIRRVTPSELANKTAGNLFYFDTEVVSLEPQDASNIDKESYLTLQEGSYRSFGYRHVVDDPNYSYSMKESGSVQLPLTILPIGNEDSPENYITLMGIPIEVSYERADVVQQFQEFLDSPQDRVTAANMLARHFLPSYASYDATYTGGSDPSVIAADIFEYIDTVPVETPIDVSEIEKRIEQRGGNPDTPTTLAIMLHDWDRKMWVEFSQNQIGGTETLVPYNGTPRVSYCTPGPDVSGQDPIPTGERINLTKR